MAISGDFRGGLQVAQTLYGAWTGEVYTINESGERTLYGTLTGSDDIFIARNNRSTPDIAVVCDAGAFILNTTAGTVDAYPDGDVGAPSCVGGHLGYMVFGYGTGAMQSSDLNSTNLNTLNTARTESNPDGVLNIISQDGQMFVMGEKTIEVWDGVNTAGFPFNRVGFHIVPGLIAKHAVAGWQSEFGHPFIWVGNDNTVRQRNGYAADKISPPDLDRLISNEVFKEDLEAICYVAGGHAFWQINGSDFSWVYNLNNQTWHERKSYLSTRSDLRRSVPAFERWLVGDTDSTDLLEIDHTLQTEGGAPLIAIMESGPAKDFPNRQRVPRTDFDFTPGVGESGGTDPIQTDPSVLIECSNDGGRTWPWSWVRKLGKQAEALQRIFVLNTGMTGDEGRRWRWTISDPVHVGFVGADMQIEMRNK